MRPFTLLATGLVFMTGAISAKGAELATWMDDVPGEIERYGAKLGNIDGVGTLQIDFNGDGAPDRIASYGVILGGNAVETRVILFENRGGSFVPLREVKTGGSIDTVVYDDGKLLFTVRVYKDGDAHCCPSGQKLVTHRP